MNKIFLKNTFKNPMTNLYVKDVEAAANFYINKFDFTETFRTLKEGVPIHIEVRLDHFTLGFAQIDAANSMHELNIVSGPPRSEVCVWTDDVDEAFAALSAQGVRVISPPHDFLNNKLRAAWLADPDGNLVQIVTRKVKNENPSV